MSEVYAALARRTGPSVAALCGRSIILGLLWNLGNAVSLDSSSISSSEVRLRLPIDVGETSIMYSESRLSPRPERSTSYHSVSILKREGEAL